MLEKKTSAETWKASVREAWRAFWACEGGSRAGTPTRRQRARHFHTFILLSPLWNAADRHCSSHFTGEAMHLGSGKGFAREHTSREPHSHLEQPNSNPGLFFFFYHCWNIEMWEFYTTKNVMFLNTVNDQNYKKAWNWPASLVLKAIQSVGFFENSGFESYPPPTQGPLFTWEPGAHCWGGRADSKVTDGGRIAAP